MDDDAWHPAGPEGDLIAIAIRHLDAANEALPDNRPEARAQLLKARALLRGDGEPGGAGAAAPAGRGALAPWQLKRVTDMIEAELSTTIKVGDLAAAVRLSKSYFCQAFRSSVGEAPYAYLLRRRVERAKSLMLADDKDLTEIALDCGLADQSHLTRVFRRLVGVTPASWRRLRRSG